MTAGLQCVEEGGKRVVSVTTVRGLLSLEDPAMIGSAPTHAGYIGQAQSVNLGSPWFVQINMDTVDCL